MLQRWALGDLTENRRNRIFPVRRRHLRREGVDGHLQCRARGPDDLLELIGGVLRDEEAAQIHLCRVEQSMGLGLLVRGTICQTTCQCLCAQTFADAKSLSQFRACLTLGIIQRQFGDATGNAGCLQLSCGTQRAFPPGM
ncbi:MAG: hypothetical protein BWY76_02310 [bacterium ADurb.Bin429]|nr:MAG: hypothetical protein BWY76_02310 [bacterium ADurb.Bin429]